MSETETPGPAPKEPRLEVNGIQVCASTLASVSAAVVASIFGVTGTVVGAAVVSIIATAGAAVYGHGIHRTSAKLQQAPAGRLLRPLTKREPDDDSPGWKQWLSQRRWGVAAGVGIVFAASLLTVTVVELVSRQPLAAIAGRDPSGNTSVGSLFDGDSSSPDDDSPTTEPPAGPTPTDADGESEEPGSSTTTSPESTERTSTTETSPSGTTVPD